ncbi:MAG: AarF/UbiB family protein, partial [Gammaproteobacteria bacterium]
KLSERGVEIFFTQVFRDGFFHADMHPGNIFVNVENPTDPQYIAVDFGIVGTLSKKYQRYLAENILAFFKRDYHRVAVLHIEWGLLSKNTRVADFEAAIRCVCEPIFEKPLKEISFGKLLLQTFQVGRRFKMEIQPQLLLLQKTLLNIEGLGRQLYPDLDLWIAGKPFLEKWVAEQLGPRALFKRFSEILPFITDKLPEMPILMYETLKAIETLPKSKHQEFYKTNKASRMMRFNLGIMCLFTGIIFSLFLLKPILNTEILLYFTGALSTIGLILLFFSLSRKDT